ncbi:hypothetical protein EIP91_008429 [Steccherinum ochraceum]|uniref:Uncharacterized protein n=1 Tax=Steccherinum ochraceum TaxID=92696 RepID=A0A4R0R2V2_9APHY|nr:hypothetical protein EIP91_008429 [Steccherinum ochraceum]
MKWQCHVATCLPQQPSARGFPVVIMVFDSQTQVSVVLKGAQSHRPLNEAWKPVQHTTGNDGKSTVVAHLEVKYGQEFYFEIENKKAAQVRRTEPSFANVQVDFIIPYLQSAPFKRTFIPPGETVAIHGVDYNQKVFAFPRQVAAAQRHQPTSTDHHGELRVRVFMGTSKVTCAEETAIGSSDSGSECGPSVPDVNENIVTVIFKYGFIGIKNSMRKNPAPYHNPCKHHGVVLILLNLHRPPPQPQAGPSQLPAHRIDVQSSPPPPSPPRLPIGPSFVFNNEAKKPLVQAAALPDGNSSTRSTASSRRIATISKELEEVTGEINSFTDVILRKACDEASQRDKNVQTTIDVLKEDVRRMKEKQTRLLQELQKFTAHQPPGPDVVDLTTDDD